MAQHTKSALPSRGYENRIYHIVYLISSQSLEVAILERSRNPLDFSGLDPPCQDIVDIGVLRRYDFWLRPSFDAPGTSCTGQGPRSDDQVNVAGTVLGR